MMKVNLVIRSMTETVTRSETRRLNVLSNVHSTRRSKLAQSMVRPRFSRYSSAHEQDLAVVQPSIQSVK